MQTLEIEGKSIDKAIEKACRDFGVSRDKLNIEIISDGSAGFLGLMGGRKARIKACLLSIDATLDMTPAPPQPERAEKMQEAGITAAAFDRPPASDDDKVGERAKTVLEGILARMGITAPVSVEETEESILLNIQGGGGGLIIGRRGQNLDAIQYIVNKAANRSRNGRKMIIIDTEAYRKRREESLVALAGKLGEKVKKTKKAVTVSHMNAHDRRIIHMALQDDASLTTKSRGEGEYRKIVIIPAKRN
ncbi:MAG: RNA-binding cell elongation regulator Jag/EloR [Syntrophales bacterium]|nr:RNA-binding cell elongation regulator Jag/EloR [Syntrophales bacterium]